LVLFFFYFPTKVARGKPWALALNAALITVLKENYKITGKYCQ